jgi:hypothetical protein
VLNQYVKYFSKKSYIVVIYHKEGSMIGLCRVLGYVPELEKTFRAQATIGSLLGQVQCPIQLPLDVVARVDPKHPVLAVRELAGCAAVLAGHPAEWQPLMAA